MQANYTKTSKPVYWDPVLISYPVRSFPETGQSSETIGRQLRSVPENLKCLKTHNNENIKHSTDFNMLSDLARSQTAVDFTRKSGETKIHYKQASSTKSQYIYPICKKLNDRPPAMRNHGTTEMRSSYTEPVTHSRLATEKEQFKNHSMHTLCEPPEHPFRKQMEPLYTTHEGFEKYLDPYLTTSRLHHTPFPPEQTDRESNKRNIITYHTNSKTPWVRSQKPSVEEWRLPPSHVRPVYDREKFKEGFREIRIHNKLQWVPGAFRTEVRDNYASKFCHLKTKVHSQEEQIRTLYAKSIARLEENIKEDSSIAQYRTESSRIGSRTPLSAIFDPYTEKSKKLK